VLIPRLNGCKLKAASIKNSLVCEHPERVNTLRISNNMPYLASKSSAQNEYSRA